MTRSSQSAAVPCRTAIGPVKKKGTTISAMVAVTGPAPFRQITPRARAKTAAMASSAALPAITRASVSPPTGKMTRPLPRSMRSPSSTAAADPASPAAKVTAAITIALAARTWPRRGAAASVVRIRPRRYSAVMNIVPTTSATISPANTPVMPASAVLLAPAAFRTAGAMSPDPWTVKNPPVWRYPPLSGLYAAPSPKSWPAHWLPGPLPDTVTWSKTPLARVAPAFSSVTQSGEVTKMPACTAVVSPGRRAVPTRVQCVPSAESYPVSVSPERTSRSHRGAAADTAPGRPAMSRV